MSLKDADKQLPQMWREAERRGTPRSEGVERGNAFMTDAPPEGNQGVGTFGVLMKPKLLFTDMETAVAAATAALRLNLLTHEMKTDRLLFVFCQVSWQHQTLERAEGARSELAAPAPLTPCGGPA